MFYSNSMKVILMLIASLIISISVCVLIIKSKNKKLKEQKDEIEVLNRQIKNKESEISLIKKEMEIEKRYNKKLTKKLADISNMSIDDVLHSLQNHSNRKNNSVRSGN